MLPKVALDPIPQKGEFAPAPQRIHLCANMNIRPPTITALSVLYMLVGLVSTSYHLKDFKAFSPTFLQAMGTILIVLLGVAAIAAGYYMLQGKNWARWLAFGWTIFHVVVSAFSSLGGIVFHVAFVFLLWLLLFSKEAKEWFTPKPRVEPMTQSWADMSTPAAAQPPSESSQVEQQPPVEPQV